jgi:hypothetical protein
MTHGSVTRPDARGHQKQHSDSPKNIFGREGGKQALPAKGVKGGS